MTLLAQIDHMQKLSAQAGPPTIRGLAAAAAHAETIAAAVELTDAQHFTAKRRAIRAALTADGVAAEIEALVDALLPP
jgi:hypothetical protein